jgi:6-phosphogluconolactonase (cycloisomerase 2 family)
MAQEISHSTANDSMAPGLSTPGLSNTVGRMAHDRRTSWVRRWFTLSVLPVLLAALCGCGGRAQKALYAVGLDSPNVTIFTVSSSGELTLLSDSVSTGSAPVAIALDPHFHFAYVVDSAGGIGPGGVSQYTVNAGSGALAVALLPTTGGAALPSTPVETGVSPAAIAIDASAAFVFVANQGSSPPGTGCTPTPFVCVPSISVYTIDSVSGTLTEVKQQLPPTCPTTQVTPCPLPTTTTPNALATTGNMLFVANAGAASVSAYTFDASGALTAAGTTPAGLNPSAMQMDASAKFLFLADAGASQVAVFSIGSSGQLTAVGSPLATGTTPVNLCVHPSGRFLYTANHGSNDVSSFSIDSSGALTKLSDTPVAPGSGPSYVATNASGSLLFVANRDSNNISVFSIDSSGALKAVSGSPFPSVVIHPVALASLN